MQLHDSGEGCPGHPCLETETNLSYQDGPPIRPDLEVLVSPIVTPLRYAHLKKASRTWVDAFEKDPVLRYIDNNRKQTPDVKDAMQIIMFCVMAYWKKRKIALTVDTGTSFIFCTAPHSPRSPLDRCMGWVIEFISKIFELLIPSGERKRAVEVETRVKNAVSRSLGDRINQMLYIDTLATEPTSQGWGYGGALLASIGALGDVTNQAIWLKSTDEKNMDFYVSHGYRAIDEAIVGDDNPDWHGAPIAIKIMVREPRQRHTTGRVLE